MWSVEHKVGRLVHVVVGSPFSMEDVEPMFQKLGRVMTAFEGRVVGCTDLRHATVLAPDVAAAVINFLRRDNPKIERSAFLVNDSALLGMQMTRILREAGNPSRRSFHDPDQAISWLTEVLNPAEQVELRHFLR